MEKNLGTGLHRVRGYTGLRGGTVDASKPEENDTTDAGILLFGTETSPPTEAMHLRPKDYMTSQWLFFYTLAIMDDDHHPKASFYTQLGVAAGAGGSVRLGFNPGEFLDFPFGWIAADL